VCALEQEYIEHTQDLIILRPPQDPDIVGHMIERWVITGSQWIPILRVRICCLPSNEYRRLTMAQRVFTSKVGGNIPFVLTAAPDY
jgi:hypothetical protein